MSNFPGLDQLSNQVAVLADQVVDLQERVQAVEGGQGPEPQPEPEPEPQPTPEPTPQPEPEPTVPAVPKPGPDDVPTPPATSHTIRIESGFKGPIDDRIEKGVVNRIVGPRDAECWLQKQHNGLKLVVEGASIRKTVYAPGGRVWFVEAEARGNEWDKDGDHVDPSPTWGCMKTIHIGGRIRHMRRGNRGPVEMYGTHVLDLYEDLVQGTGKLRIVLAERICYPHWVLGKDGSDPHPDIIQGPGIWDIDGLHVDTSRGQYLALASDQAAGTQVRNYTAINSQGVGAGLKLEEKSNGSLSDAYFKGLRLDKPLVIETSGDNAWRGNNVRFVDCKFADWYIEDQTFNSGYSA